MVSNRHMMLMMMRVSETIGEDVPSLHRARANYKNVAASVNQRYNGRDYNIGLCPV